MAEKFYKKLKKELTPGQVLHTTRPSTEYPQGRKMIFSGWSPTGELRIGYWEQGEEHYLHVKAAHLKEIYLVYDPDRPKLLHAQIKKICRYMDKRNRVIYNIMLAYA